MHIRFAGDSRAIVKQEAKVKAPVAVLLHTYNFVCHDAP
jgi:hypothetical protein